MYNLLCPPNPKALYSTPPKAGWSGFRMAISRTLFVSGFQMASHLVLAAILLKPFKNRTFFWFSNGQPSFYHLKAGPDFFPTSLDRFVMNKILFMTVY
jgi:hypothetical protein